MAQTYLEMIESELLDLLQKASPDDIVAWVKERLLESFRNGQRMPKKETPWKKLPSRFGNARPPVGLQEDARK